LGFKRSVRRARTSNTVILTVGVLPFLFIRVETFHQFYSVKYPKTSAFLLKSYYHIGDRSNPQLKAARTSRGSRCYRQARWQDFAVPSWSPRHIVPSPLMCGRRHLSFSSVATLWFHARACVIFSAIRASGFQDIPQNSAVGCLKGLQTLRMGGLQSGTVVGRTSGLRHALLPL